MPLLSAPSNGCRLSREIYDTFCLRAAAGTADISVQSADFRRRPMPEHKREYRRILIVDDEPTIVEFVDRVLRRAGYETATATAGPEAVRLAATSAPFDLIVTDVNMPEMSGPDMVSQLRQQQPDVPVLYLTGFNDQLFAAKTILWEGEAFLDKPATVDGLLQAVSLMMFGHISGDRRPAIGTIKMR
jgi:CheY-like chemotaxis protein